MGIFLHVTPPSDCDLPAAQDLLCLHKVLAVKKMHDECVRVWLTAQVSEATQLQVPAVWSGKKKMLNIPGLQILYETEIIKPPLSCCCEIFM